MPNVNVLAAESNAPEHVLGKYLTALEKLNVDKALTFYTDSRAGNDTVKETILREALSDPNQQITKSSILNRYEDTENEVILLANIEYKNGQIAQVPFKLEKNDETWIVKIGADLPVESEYKIIQQGTQILQNTTKSSDVMQTLSLSQKTTWNFTLSSSDPYGPDTQYTSNFNVTSSNMIEINYRQWEIWDIPNIEYAIVKWGLFSNTVYAKQAEYLDNENYANQIYLSVSSNLSGVCLRVKHLNVTYTANSFGEVYN